jgi:serine/threonine protein kinase/tetratricopeptide (TPR) repeat protein
VNESQVFADALKLSSPAERAAYLERACAGNPPLRSRVEVLLQAHASDPGFLEQPAGALAGTGDEAPVPTGAASAEQPGMVLAGRYKLVEAIGEGGMGAVWVAQQTEPVKRLVAVKLVKAGMDSRAVLARFEQERQALALMDHPNIAKVLDAGAGPDGRPFFVMELVKGVPITRFFDERRLTPRQRLELFVPVCQAIQHAHQKGVIHRDVKPSNVLVALYDDRPVVKVIDFGVAKATGQQLTEQTLHTGFGSVVGTLEYMSPEQANLNSLDIDTRSDIYSLGVLLYELLTGSTPFSRKEIEKGGMLEMLRVIREQEPTKPSTKLSTAEGLPTLAANRGTEPAKLRKLVRGELDWIVMKALEKDRSRRYETANAFALDVQRYLADEPVQACPPSAWYRCRKFARRNKGALVTGTLLGMATLGLLLAVLYHNAVLRRAAQTAHDAAQTAQEKKRLARQVVDEMYTEVAEQLLAVEPHRKEAQRQFLLKALQFYQEFAREEGADPSVQFEAALACERVGNIQRLLGQHGPAEHAYRQALGRLEKLTADFPDDPRYRRQLCSNWNELAGLLVTTRRHPEAEQACLQALDIGKKLEAEFPDSLDYPRDMASTHHHLGILFRNLGRLPEAEHHYRQSLRRRQRLVADISNNPDLWNELAASHHGLGILLGATGQPGPAEQNYRQALEIRQKLAADHFARPEFRERLGSGQFEWANLLMNTGRAKKAEEAFGQARAVYEKLAEDFPTVSQYRFQLSISHNNLGNLLAKTGRSHEAEPIHRRALEIRQKLVRDFPDVPDYRAALASSFDNLGSVMTGPDRLQEGEQASRQALGILAKLAADFPDVPEYRNRLATSHYNLAHQLADTDRPGEAEQHYRRALEIREKLAADFPTVATYQHLLGGTLHNLASLPQNQKNPAKARQFFERAVQHQQRAFQTNPKHMGYRQFLGLHYSGLGEALLALGEHAEAARTAAEAPRLYPNSWQECVRAAEFLARCMPLVEKDARLTEDQRRTLAQRYAHQAVAWLREAVARGCKDAAPFTKPRAFDPLRSRADFQQLMKELAGGQAESERKRQESKKPPS